MRIFAPEGILARTLNKTGDLIILNLLTLVCCLPIVTAGASITAMYSVTLKMVRNEEGHAVTAYLKAFRDNFKPACLLWLAVLGLVTFLVGDIYLLRGFSSAVMLGYRGVLITLLVLILLGAAFLFPVLARFENTLMNTVKNAFLFCLVHPVRSMMMLLVLSIPLAMIAVSPRFVPVGILVGVSGPAFLASMYFRSLFDGYAKEEKECRG